MNGDEVFAVLTANVREVVPDLVRRSLTRADNLGDLGANSVDRAEIVALTLAKLSVRIPMVALSQATNLGELAEAIHERL